MASKLTPVPDDLDLDATIQGLDVSQKVFGRYTLRQILGRGGMGVVWLAYDERLGRQVALKFLPDAVSFDPSALDDLKRETCRCLDLTHPNIIRIYDFVTDEQAAAISMEYIDGKTLATLRVEKAGRVFEVEEVKNWTTKVCHALHYAHEEVQVVHRDLKPANLMLTSSGQIKIADFGIARSVSDLLSHLTMRRNTSGTLVYMSPQQMNGERPRVTDDVYSLGATIYECLTSKPPFYSGDIPFQVRLSLPRTMTERRQELEISGQDIPKDWEDTVAACLAKMPEQRPAGMMELAECLGLSLATMRTAVNGRSKPVTTEKEKHGRPWGKLSWLPRKPVPVKRILQVSGLLVFLALVGGAFWHFLMWPFFAPPGELRLTSSPLGARVHISGMSDQITPATFFPIRIGHYRIRISAEGFEPLEQTVTVTTGSKIDLGALQLERAVGRLELVTLPAPAHYFLAGAANTGNFHKEGSTPELLWTLPSGSYQLTLTESAFPQSTKNIQVLAHATTTVKVDFIQLSVAVNASLDTAKVFRGDGDAGQLDTTGRSELAELYDRAFEEYLSSGLVASASRQLVNLKGLGQDIEARKKQLAKGRASTEKGITAQISSLINEKKSATAAEKLKNLADVLEKESVDRLNAEFQGPLAQYQQQIDAAIKTSGSPAIAYDHLKIEIAQYPDDLRLQLALAETQMRMPPDHDRLSTQLKNFLQFSAQNKDFGMEQSFLATQAEFASELKQLDALSGALLAAKNDFSRVLNKIASLESQMAAMQKRPIGSTPPGPVAETVNFFGRVVTGHSFVTTGSFFSSEQEKEQAIAAVQVQIDSARVTLSQAQSAINEAQKRYDNFLAEVPWQQK